MKRQISIALLFLVVALTSCTHNNGDIGEFFGEWRLVSMTTDGEPVKLYGEGAEDFNPDFGAPLIYTLAFQDNMARINVIYAHHEYESIFGTWEQQANRLVLNFSYHDDQNDSYGYSAPAVFRFPADGVAVTTIEKFKEDDLILSLMTDESVNCIYHFVKQH